MVDKGVILAMFQYEPALFYKYFRIQYKFRKCRNDIQIKWRVCKNHATGTSKEVKHPQSRKSVGIGKPIEQSLSGKIRGWPGLKRTWYRDVPSFVCATDYPQ